MVASNKVPLISVIVPVYNAASYLAEAIDSVIQQSIGFTENVEIILVDDGSTDNSKEVCARYVQRYPANISYIRQKNRGVSAARNRGITVAKGEYVTFLDADDMWSKHAFRRMVSFLEMHREVDFVACRIDFFEKIIDQHPLNFKFATTRVIDVRLDPNNPLLHVITCLFRKDSIVGIRFNEGLEIAEDSIFIAEVLAQKNKYGVVSNTPYYYRKRNSQNSAINTGQLKPSYYTKTPVLSYEKMLKLFEKNSQYAQYTVLYDLSYRIKQASQSILSDGEETRYVDTISALVAQIEDGVICQNEYLTVDEKIFILKMKHGSTLSHAIQIVNGRMMYARYQLQDLSLCSVHLDFVKSSNGMIEVEGTMPFDVSTETIGFEIMVGGQAAAIAPVERQDKQITFLGKTVCSGGGFRMSHSIRSGVSISFRYVSGDEVVTLEVDTGRFTRLSSIRGAYSHAYDLLIRRTRNRITFHTYSVFRHIAYETRYLLAIMVHINSKKAIDLYRKVRQRNAKQLSIKAQLFEYAKPSLVVLETLYYMPKALLLRSMYHVARLLQSKPIWIISDRGMAAGDNGEALFRYTQQYGNDAKVYFAISRKSSDYQRIRGIGPTLNTGSLRYQLLFLLSDKIISSHADVEVTNPFIRQIDHYVDLMTFDFVFLQHGIIRNDLSDWLNRYEQNIKLFITSAHPEYKSIFTYPYHYEENKVALTGLPRHDYLDNTSKNKLVITPTYRNGLLHLPTDKYGERRYDPYFKSSDYFTFYNRLIHDERINTALKRYDMTGVFCVHPNFAQQRDDFTSSDMIEVASFPYDYKTILSEGSLMVTDYSSISLDFAYMGKPVIYTHFDEDAFYKEAIFDKGDFFNDETDGFGPVTITYERLVDAIISSIKDGCRLDAKYENRRSAFFYKIDKQNSKRVYDEIIKLGTTQ